jgi:hypothetical protein
MKTLTLKLIALTVAFSASLLITGCGSGSAAKTTANPDTNTGTTSPDSFTYKGQKPASNPDIKKFETSLWVNIAREDRCGGCHNATGQAPRFARADDINLAYEALVSNGLVTLSNPGQSVIVDKVTKGHNCWLPNAAACGDTLVSWINNWAGPVTTTANSVALTAPAEKDVANSKTFPTDPKDSTNPDNFAKTVYPVLTEYCSRCHSETAVTKQQPYFAQFDSQITQTNPDFDAIYAANLEIAYDASKTKIRLDNPAQSRFVQRLSADAHNCWGDCAANAAEMQEKITRFANSIAPVKINPDLVVSKTVGFGDAFVLTSGGRVDTNLIAKYEFKTGKGTIAYDTSGVEPAAHLNLLGNVAWSSAWGIKVKETGRAQATTATSRKFFDLIRASGEYSIEAWIIPDNVTQGANDNNPARIVTYSGSAMERNFSLGQYEYNYSFLNRTDKSDGNGLRELHTQDADQKLQATLQHVVVTYDPTNGRRIYVNGEFTGDADTSKGAILKDWDSSYALALGNEVSGDLRTQWQGNIRFLGVHKRAMTAEDISANYKVGVGAKYLLLFNVSTLIGTPDSYLVFEVQQFDDYGYLFANPFFTNLKGTAITGNIPVKGIRIGVNGEEPVTGQVFANLTTTLSSAAMVGGRQALSPLGTVIELKAGPDQDQFFLTFDQIADKTFARTAPVTPPAATPADVPNQPLIGLRRFAEINAALSSMTGIPQSNATVRLTYNKVQQQLPTLANLDGFLAAQQMGITQLAVTYCNVLVGNSSAPNSLRDSYFDEFNFALPAASAFSPSGRTQIIEPLLKRLIAAEINGTALTTQASPALLRTELNNLIDTMTACTNTNSCAADRTLTTVKATCAAAMGSAVMLLQ